MRALALGAVLLAGGMLQGGEHPQLQAGILASLPSAREAGEVWATSPVTPEAPDPVIVGGTSMRATTPPGIVDPSTLGSAEAADPAPEIDLYVVEEGDTVASVAKDFDITEETVRTVNELGPGEGLRTGQELTILPVPGALHLVRPYDTLSEIAGWYQADMERIAEFNELDSSGEIYAGDLLIVPGGTEPNSLPSSRLTPIANSYFIYPISAPHRKTQGLHHYNAVDFSNNVCGEPVYAAAGGTVQRTGYSSIGGNHIRILHGNGVVTYYGHLSSFAVSPGSHARQGQIIGYTGHSGYTIPAGPDGCHLHFGVRGARNPFAN